MFQQVELRVLSQDHSIGVTSGEDQVLSTALTIDARNTAISIDAKNRLLTIDARDLEGSGSPNLNPRFKR